MQSKVRKLSSINIKPKQKARSGGQNWYTESKQVYTKIICSSFHLSRRYAENHITVTCNVQLSARVVCVQRFLSAVTALAALSANVSWATRSFQRT